MKIDSAIGVFTEKFDSEAIKSIDEVSREFGLNVHGHTIKLFNLTESFDLFQRYLDGYKDYKISNIGNPKASPHSAICEATEKFIDSQIFKEANIPYSELPSFVKGYVEGINSLAATINSTKEAMMEAGVDLDEVGVISDFTERFMEGLDTRFDSAMDKILWASGYNSKKAIFGGKKNEHSKKGNVVFI